MSLHDDPAARVCLSDMTGDGLNDIVQVHDGNISYSPNLGYGRFGRPTIMELASETGYEFDTKRLLPSDIDGIGYVQISSRWILMPFFSGLIDLGFDGVRKRQFRAPFLFSIEVLYHLRILWYWHISYRIVL